MPAIVDLFAGAGGLSLGLEQAGFEVLSGAEWDADACQTFAKAHPSADVLEGDIGAMSFQRWRGKVDVLVGGPPCQPWSVGGLRRGAEDPRDGWPIFLRVLKEVRPTAFIAENVAGFATGIRREHFESLIADLAGAGFHVVAKVMNAADYGVPQRRQRLVIVGMRDSAYQFPRRHRDSWIAAGSVIGSEPVGIPNPAIVTFARRPDLRPNPYDGHLFNGGGRPIDLTQPSRTLLASMGGNKTPWVDTLGIVPEYHSHLLAGGAARLGIVPGARRITVEESAMLQTFPLGMAFAGRRSSQYRQIGNAVPPALAYAVGSALARQLR
jgi:DNA (cytosine-5)-methyltransferase 1